MTLLNYLFKFFAFIFISIFFYSCAEFQPVVQSEYGSYRLNFKTDDVAPYSSNSNARLSAADLYMKKHNLIPEECKGVVLMTKIIDFENGFSSAFFVCR